MKMSPIEVETNLEFMASCFYRLVEGRPWVYADERDKQNYLAVSREAVERVKVEQSQQQPEDGRKEVA